MRCCGPCPGNAGLALLQVSPATLTRGAGSRCPSVLQVHGSFRFATPREKNDTAFLVHVRVFRRQCNRLGWNVFVGRRCPGWRVLRETRKRGTENLANDSGGTVKLCFFQSAKKRPEFSLESSDGGTVRLSDFTGKNYLVLIFYPGDDTPGCTKQLCAIRGRFTRNSRRRTPRCSA